MCKTYCYLSKISLPPIQATALFLSTFPNKALLPCLYLSGARTHLETAFETSFCISVVTRWGMQALSQKRWCTSSQSWLISVLWGEEQELHSGSSASHVKNLRWLLSSDIIIHIFQIRKWDIKGRILTIIESISKLVPVSAWEFLKMLAASRFQQSRLLRPLNWVFLLFFLSMEAKLMCL